MWGQLIMMHCKPGKEAEVPRVMDRLRSAEQPGSGLLRSTTMVDEKDPRRVYTFVLFESEEAARAREADPRRQEALADVRAMMAEVFEGAPEFVDLAVVADSTY